MAYPHSPCDNAVSIPEHLELEDNPSLPRASHTSPSSHKRKDDLEQGMKDITRRDSHPSTNSINSSTSQAPTTCTPHVSSSSDSTLNPNRFTRFRSSDNFLSFTVGLALFVDLLCYGIIMPITPFIIARLGLQSTANGALIAAYAAGTLIASPIVGILSDKMANRRTPMLVGLVALLLSMVMFMEALDHYWILLVSRLAAGVAGGTMMTLGFALLSDTYPANQLGMQMGKVMIGHTMGMMAGPPLGGILQEHVGTKAPYVFCLILITIDLAARLLIIEPRTAKVKAMREYQKRQELEHQQNHEPNYNTDAPAATVSTTTLASGNESPSILLSATIKELSVMRELLTSRRLLTALFISFLEAFLVSALEPVLPLYLEHRFAFSETQIGLSFLAFSVPTIISPVAGYISDRYGTKIMSGIAVSFCSVFVVLLGIPGMPLWGIMLLLVATGSCCAVFITPVLGEISAVVRVTGEGDGFARAFALFNMCFSVGMLAGPLLGSLIYQETSMLWTSVLNGAITIVGVPLVLLYAGDKAQKLRDQAQYEKDKMEEDMMVGQIQQQEITEMKPSLYTPRSHPPAGDAS